MSHQGEHCPALVPARSLGPSPWQMSPSPWPGPLSGAETQPGRGVSSSSSACGHLLHSGARDVPPTCEAEEESTECSVLGTDLRGLEGLEGEEPSLS